ncbi:hypothetical protein HDU98_001399, partial [Podochytrium sp. JEL0797]
MENIIADLRNTTASGNVNVSHSTRGEALEAGGMYTAASPFGHVAFFMASATAGGITGGWFGERTDKLSYMYRTLEELPVAVRVAIACSVQPNLEVVKKYVGKPNGVGWDAIVLPCVEFTALDWAARRGHYEIAEYLLTSGSSPNAGTPFIWACYMDNIPMAKLLIEHRVDMDKRFPGGVGAMHYAGENGAIECLKWLVMDLGVSPFDKNAKGQDLLQHLKDVGMTHPNMLAIMSWLKEWMGHYEKLAKAGTRVELYRLKNHDMNGKIGTVVRYAKKNRVAVEIDGSVMSLKSHNLKILASEPERADGYAHMKSRQIEHGKSMEKWFSALTAPDLVILSRGTRVHDVLTLSPGAPVSITFTHAGRQVQKSFAFHDPASLAQ